ncbi:MAG: hypothetical protein P1U77_18880 [Rubripirellula sp.]|nr:hypothetical protein [Rubripirellula sp.]
MPRCASWCCSGPLWTQVSVKRLSQLLARRVAHNEVLFVIQQLSVAFQKVGETFVIGVNDSHSLVVFQFWAGRAAAVVHLFAEQVCHALDAASVIGGDVVAFGWIVSEVVELEEWRLQQIGFGWFAAELFEC